MIDLVNALLDVSRMELGAFVLQLVKKDMKVLIYSILEEVRPVIDKKKLILQKVLPKKSSMVLIDESLFRMVINNILVNAIHYTPSGGTIIIECKEMKKDQLFGTKKLTEDCFTVTVADTGCGIPSNQQDKLFAKFFRADNAQENHPEGTGLGLYIVKSVLDNSGGSIYFTSQQNKGTTFYVTIPMTGMKKIRI
jgi:signal transduction histidine kinase